MDVLDTQFHASPLPLHIRHQKLDVSEPLESIFLGLFSEKLLKLTMKIENLGKTEQIWKQRQKASSMC